jgi:hypothetical protein
VAQRLGQLFGLMIDAAEIVTRKLNSLAFWSPCSSLPALPSNETRCWLPGKLCETAPRIAAPPARTAFGLTSRRNQNGPELDGLEIGRAVDKI